MLITNLDKEKLILIYYSLFNQTECFCGYKDYFNDTLRFTLEQMQNEFRSLNLFDKIYSIISEDKDYYFEILNDKLEAKNYELI